MSRSATLIRVGRDEKGLLKLLIAAQCHRRTQMTTFIVILLLISILCTVSPFARGLAGFAVVAIIALTVIGSFAPDIKRASNTPVTARTFEIENQSLSTFSDDAHVAAPPITPNLESLYNSDGTVSCSDILELNIMHERAGDGIEYTIWPSESVDPEKRIHATTAGVVLTVCSTHKPNHLPITRTWGLHPLPY
jgi:hypothetical protein